MNDINFTVSMKYNCLHIENKTKQNLLVMKVPEEGKRKYETALTVRPGSFHLREQANIDLSKLCFRLQPRETT